MTPLGTLLDRIRWDPRLDATRFRVRWTRRGESDAIEPLATFLARRDVPQHRVRALSCDGVVVWDRDDGTDRVDDVAVRAAASAPLRSFALWNVQGDADNAVAAASFDVDAAAFVEVTADFVARLQPLTQRQLFAEGSVALLVDARPWTALRLPLPGRDALLLSDGTQHICVAHLTSNVHGDRSQRRREQRESLLAALPKHGPLALLLDANDEDDLDEFASFTDVGAAAGATWKGNERRPPRRIDRIFLRGVDVGVERFARVFVDRAVAGSDHWPVIACPRAAMDLGAGVGAAPMRAYDDPQRALCILPPPALSTSIDAIRRAHDKAFVRWPPHINLAFPFVDDVNVYGAVARAVAAIDPFTIRFGPSAPFGHGKCAATVVDDGACARLMAAVGAPAKTPHLTLTSDGVDAAIDGEFVVDRVVVLARDDGAFVVFDEFICGDVDLGVAVAETGLCEFTAPRALPAKIAAALSSLPGTVTLVGSSALGVRFVDSDVDVAWEPPLSIADPLAFLIDRLGGTRVDAVAAPRIKTVIDGVEVDIVVGAADARRSATAVLSDTQREALRAVRLWARRRGLRPKDNNATARAEGIRLPSSVAWLALVLDEKTALDDAAPEEILRAIWQRLADEGDVDAVSGTGFRGVTPRALSLLRKEATRAAAYAPAWRTIFGPALVP